MEKFSPYRDRRLPKAAGAQWVCELPPDKDNARIYYALDQRPEPRFKLQTACQLSIVFNVPRYWEAERWALQAVVFPQLTIVNGSVSMVDVNFTLKTKWKKKVWIFFPRLLMSIESYYRLIGSIVLVNLTHATYHAHGNPRDPPPATRYPRRPDCRIGQDAARTGDGSRREPTAII